MSSIIVSFGHYDNPKIVYKNNKEWLREEFGLISWKIEKNLEILDKESKKNIFNDIKELNKLENQLINEYTLDTCYSSDHEKFLENLVNIFDENAQRVKQKIKRLKLEQKEKQKRANEQLEELKKELPSILSSDILETYKKDFKNLKKELQDIEKISSLTVKEKRIAQVKNNIQNSLKKHELAKTVNISGLEEEKIKVNLNKEKKQIALDKLKIEIYKYYELVKNLDEDIYTELKPIIKSVEKEKHEQRVKMVKDQVKLKYGKLKENITWSYVFKESLTEFKDKIATYDNSECLLKRVTNLLNKKYITKSEFEIISKEVNKFILRAEKNKLEIKQKNGFITKVKENLRELGYSVLDNQVDDNLTEKIEKGEIVYLDTKWEDYKVMLKLTENSELTTRIIKAVETEEEKENISTYQKQKDIEIAQQWCKDYDTFLNKLRQISIKIEVRIRKEPEEVNLMYVVNRELVRSGKSKTDKAEKEEVKQYKH